MGFKAATNCRRNNLRLIIYVIIIVSIMQSCTKDTARWKPIPCEGELPELFACDVCENSLHIRATVRIDLPQYRVRGLCAIRSTPGGDLRIDFHHTSLFGAYREDATIFLRHGKIAILDRERDAFFGNDSTLSILRDHLDFNVVPGDIANVLLFEHPACPEISSVKLVGGTDSWRLTGTWRERHIEIEGKRSGGPTRITQCALDVRSCYVIAYEYRRGAEEAYPSRITVTRENGSARLSMEVRDITREPFGDEIFDLFDSLMR